MISELNIKENEHVVEVLKKHLLIKLSTTSIILYDYSCSFSYSKDPHNPSYYSANVKNSEGMIGIYYILLKEFKEVEKIIIKEERDTKIDEILVNV